MIEAALVLSFWIAIDVAHRMKSRRRRALHEPRAVELLDASRCTCVGAQLHEPTCEVFCTCRAPHLSRHAPTCPCSHGRDVPMPAPGRRLD